MRKISLSLCLLALLPLTMRAQSTYDKGFEIAKNLEIFSNIYRNIHLNYVDDIDPGKTMKVAIDAMLASLDPYTNYYPESNIEDVKLQMLGEYGGVGSVITMKDSNIYIAEPYQGMPVDEAGLKAGDRIVAVNGVSTKGKDVGAVSEAMRGQAGTQVTLTVERNGETLERTLTRKEIKFPAVPYYGFVAGDMGYIKLDEYTKGAAQQVADAFKALRKERPQMRGLILDLRGNGGGLMDQAVDIVNLFLPKGELIVETKGKIASKNMKSFTRMAPIDTEIPVAVLMDGSSASASEITAGSLQDLDRAIIIGHRSYGKGLVQNILPMSYNTQMKVTVSKYYIPSGRCIQAIDYAHRDADGKAIKVPDSLKTAYKTRAGRTVYDGFGIEPDVELPVEYMSTLAMALESKQLVFEYATQFYYAHPTIDSADKFVITDEIYNDFKQFLASKDYSYKTVTESILSDLREAAKEEEYLESIGAEIDRLEARFKADKQSDLDRHRDEIADLLRAEIVTRYYYNRGCLKAMLTTDPFVAKAVEVLSDKAQYNKLLGK